MTSRRIDQLLVALGVILILISSYQLFFLGREEASGTKLGTLTRALSVVKIKHALSLDWRDASIGNDLTENQLIYTDVDSSAEITFLEGNSLFVGENSLIKLSSSRDEHSMDLSKGFIRAKLEGDKPLVVTMNGEEYTVSGKNADIQINLQNEKGEIGVISGEVVVKTEGLTENLNATSALEIDGKKITKRVIRYQVQVPDEPLVYIAGDTHPFTLAWEPGESATVFVSKKSNFQNPIHMTSEAEATIDLTPGHYYYKVESDEGSSLVGTVRIVKEAPPEILRPKDGEEVRLFDDSSKVILQWLGEEQTRYLVEWNDGENHLVEVPGAVLELPFKESKVLDWRVKLQSEARPFAVWSPWQKIHVQYLPIPTVPTDLTPDGVEYQTYEKPNEKIEFKWAGTKKSELQIKNPKNEVLTFNLDNHSYEYLAHLAGSYEWRVRGIDDYKRAGAWSEWKSFMIEDLSGVINQEGIQRIQLNRPDQQVTFNWKAEEGATTVFELSSDKNFSKIIKKEEVKSDNTQVVLPKVGVYYWRSKHYLPNGTIDVSEPRRVIIEPVPAPVKPNKLPDMEVPLQEFPKTTSLWDFFISSAHADELKGVVYLSLPVKEEAKKFVVRIYRDAGLTDLIFEQETSEKNVEWKNAEAGTYYWQYAVIDFWDRKSDFSDPATLTITNDLLTAPVKPKLISPIKAVEVANEKLVLQWSESAKNQSYRVEISETEDFKKVISSRKTKDPTASFSETNLPPKMYYWRVFAFNNKNKEILSNTGRFTILPPREKTIIEDHPIPEFPWRKEWKNNAFIGWAPSMDTYTFTDGKTGKIDGNTLFSGIAKVTLFKEKMIYNGELLRQSGQVYKDQNYLFQRLAFDGVRIFNDSTTHKWGVGLTLGHSSGNAYEVDSEDKVTSKSVSGMSYGLLFRNYYSLNKDWDIQGRIQYLLGEIKQTDLDADFIRHQKNYLLLAGIGLSMRDYELNEGNQNSFKLSLGIGKEF